MVAGRSFGAAVQEAPHIVSLLDDDGFVNHTLTSIPLGKGRADEKVRAVPRARDSP